MKKDIKTINELCLKVTDGSHFSPPNVEDGIYPMYSVKDMRWNSFDDCNCKYISKEIYLKLCKSDCRPLKDDILIAKDGSYLKYVFKSKADLNACILSSIAILRPNSGVIDPDYFVHLLRTNSVKSAMANYVSGSALPRIILSDFKKMKLKIHSQIEEQRVISSILNQYDNLIENNNKRMKILEQTAQEIYKEWFVRFRFPGYDSTRFEHGIPNGWAVTFVKKLCEIKTGKKDANQSIENGKYPFFTCARENTLFSNEYIYDGKVVLISGNGSYTGLVKKYNGKFDLYQRTYYLHNFEDNLWLYIYLTFKLNFEIIYMGGINGSAIPYITKPDIEKYKILVPNIDLIVKFNAVVEPIYNLITKLENKNDNLIKQRDLLLPRLMSGKLEVK